MPSLYRTFLAAVVLALVPGASAQPAPLDLVWERVVSAQAGARGLAFSPDGQTVATGGVQRIEDGHAVGRVDLFAAADGTPLAHREAHGDAVGVTNAVAFSPDGSVLASGHGNRVCEPGCVSDRGGLFTWSVPALSPLLAGEVHPQDLPYAVAFAPSGPALAVASLGGDGRGGSGRLLRLYGAEALAPGFRLYADGYAALDAAFHPNGQTVASTGSGSDLKLWDVGTGMLLHQVQHGLRHTDGIASSVAFSPDGQTIATGGTGGDVHVKVWRAADLVLIRSLDANDASGGQVSGNAEVPVAFSPNGAYLVGASVIGADSVSVIRFWDAATGVVVAEYLGAGTHGITAIAFSPGQDHLFAFVSGESVWVARTTLSLAEPLVVAGDTGPALEGAFRLASAGPNPSAAPALALTVAEPQRVRAEAFDALGRRVAVLHDGFVAAGAPVRLTLVGARLSPGTYVVRIVGERFAAARTVAVVR